MALRQDEESNTDLDTDSAVAESSEESFSSKPLAIIGRQSPKSNALSVSHSGKAPSNLSKAMLASTSSSLNTVRADVTHEGEPDIVSETDEEQPTLGEDTPLLPSHRGRRQSLSHSAWSGRHEFSQSRSKSPSAGQEAAHSSFSILSTRSNHMEASGHNNSSAYGYGALAQASQSQRAGDGHHVSFAEDDSYREASTSHWYLKPWQWRRGTTLLDLHSMTLGLKKVKSHARKFTWQDVVKAFAEPVHLLPAVFLGVLLNVLDGVSYGLIIFPTSYPIFSNFGGDGVSMFFVTCIISQLVYTLGGSIFKGGNGSMMIEVVPFYHILVKIIIDFLGDEDPAAVVTTTMLAFALSSIFAGLVFLLLGYFRLGVLIGFFPRHILVGCIGGVGVFLIETGLEVSAQLKSEEGFEWNLATLHYFTQSWTMVAHWVPPLALAILLRLLTSKFHNPLIFPGYFLVIPAIFYAVVFGILKLPLDELQRNDWVFDVGSAADAPFWRFYTYFDFSKTSWKALWATMPTQVSIVLLSLRR